MLPAPVREVEGELAAFHEPGGERLGGLGDDAGALEQVMGPQPVPKIGALVVLVRLHEDVADGLA